MEDIINLKLLYLLCLLLNLFAYGILADAPSDKGKSFASSQHYTFGVIPQFKKNRMFQIWQPIVAILEKKLDVRITLVISNSIPEFEDLVLQGQFDFAYMNPYQVLLSNQSKGYQPIAFDPSSKLQGIIVVRKDSKISTLSELAGKEIVFPAPNAFGASVLVRAELSQKPNFEYSPFYVRNHDMAYFYVVNGNFMAAGGVKKSLEKQPKLLQDKLRIIYETKPVSGHAIAIKPTVASEVRDSLYQAFYAMSKNKQHRLLLQKIPMDDVAPASLDIYNELTELGLEKYYPQKEY